MIKNMLWFLRESKSYMNMSLVEIIFKYQGIKRAFNFARECAEADRLTKKYGPALAYAMMNRTIEIEI